VRHAPERNRRGLKKKPSDNQSEKRDWELSTGHLRVYASGVEYGSATGKSVNKSKPGKGLNEKKDEQWGTGGIREKKKTGSDYNSSSRARNLTIRRRLPSSANKTRNFSVQQTKRGIEGLKLGRGENEATKPDQRGTLSGEDAGGGALKDDLTSKPCTVGGTKN